MQDKPEPIAPIVVTTVTDDRGEEALYKGIPVSQLITDGKCLEDIVCLLWTGKLPDKFTFDVVRRILILVADHGPSVAGAYSTILATSAGLEMPQAVAAGVQMIGPRFGGASGAAAKNFKEAVENNETIDGFVSRLKSEGVVYIPGIGHKVFSKSKPDKRVKDLISFVLSRHSGEPKATPESLNDGLRDAGQASMTDHPHLRFALALEEELLMKNEKLILNIDGTIGAVFMDLGFPLESVDGFFILARTVGFIAHYIDQKQRGTGLIRLPEELVLYK